MYTIKKITTQIPGVTVVQQSQCVLLFISPFTSQLKKLIRSQLAGVWSGFAEVEEIPQIHSYKRTLESFLDTYRTKDERTQKGMIGELLAHIIINHLFGSFTSLSILKNKEEKSIKKGFDIIYHDESLTNLWYSEVKSGRRESGNETSDAYNNILLGRAHSSLRDMFLEKRSKLWESALIDVGLTIKGAKRKFDLKTLLDSDSPANNSQGKKNAIFISVLYHCPKNEPIAMKSIIEFYTKIKNANDFSDCIILSFQKELFEKVAQFLESELKAQ